MEVVYALEPKPERMSKSIFLAGPTPRSSEVPSWRPEALRILESELGFDGHVFVPEPRNRAETFSSGFFDYTGQVEWEAMGLHVADIIVFWLPRDMKDMPGLTTNDEFGFWKASGKVVFGTPPEAFRVSYQKHYAKKLGFASNQTLRETLNEAVSRIGGGAVREKGETWVPLHVWSTPTFQTWYSALRSAGHELHHATVVWTFHAGPSRAVFFWALHVDVLVAGENRHKTNEVVISRPDACSVLLFRRRGTNIADAQVVLVKEFRSACSNSRGFVYELPGGSSWKNDSSPLGTALEETEEEVGLRLPSQRFTQHTTRQFVATMSAHSGHLFSAELTEEELGGLVQKQKAGTAHGVLEDTERTYVEVRTLGEILSGGYVDWSTLGMILSVLHA